MPGSLAGVGKRRLFENAEIAGRGIGVDVRAEKDKLPTLGFPALDQAPQLVKPIFVRRVLFAIDLKDNDHPRLIGPPSDRLLGRLDHLNARVDQRRVGAWHVGLRRQPSHLRQSDAAVERVDALAIELQERELNEIAGLRFYDSVEIDTVRPVKAFEAIVSAVVLELQRTKGVKVKLMLEIEADAEDGFSGADIGVVRDNARQLKFKPESTGFE